MTLGWVFYGATAYWSGHMGQIFGDLGNVGSSLDSGVTERIVGNPEHVQMLYLRAGFSGLFLLVAMVGLYMNRRAGNSLLLSGLSFTPFVLIALQSYGGEVVLRSFVFALPALSIAAAEIFRYVVLNRVSRSWAIPVGAVIVSLGMTLLAVLGANALYERITPAQLAAVDVLNEAVPLNSSIGALNPFNPLGRLQPERTNFDYLSTRECFEPGAVGNCTIPEHPDYLYITSTQDAYGELVEDRPPGWANDIVRQLVDAGSYRIAYQVEDVIILQYLEPGM
jgi:hypothetical protein